MKGQVILSFLLFIISTSLYANEFSLLFYTAPKKLDWSSPGKLTRRTLANNLFAKIGIIEDGEYQYVTYPHAISHVNIKIHCQGEDAIYTGMTGTQSNGTYLRKLLFEGGSLETMIENTPGRLYTTAEVLRFLPTMKKRGFVHEMRYRINKATCRALKNYLREYKEYEQDQIYGGLASVPWRY